MNDSILMLDGAIRKFKDFPKPNILFYDITGVLMQPKVFRFCIDEALRRFDIATIDAIAAIDARGFLFAAPIASRLGKPLLLARKNGKLPGPTYTRSFALEYGDETLEIHRSDVVPGSRILIVDDLIATGQTLLATGEIIAEGGAAVVGIFAIIGLKHLNYRAVLAGYRTEVLIDYPL